MVQFSLVPPWQFTISKKKNLTGGFDGGNSKEEKGGGGEKKGKAYTVCRQRYVHQKKEKGRERDRGT